MNKLQRKKVNRKDVTSILNNLRDIDEEEAIKLCGNDFRNEQIENILKSDSTIAVDKKTKKPVFLYGVTPLADGAGVIFMLSTPDIVNYKRFFIIEFKKEIIKYSRKYYFLFNLIYKKNILAKKWLKSAGFKFDVKPPREICPSGFEYFYKIRKLNKTKGLN